MTKSAPTEKLTPAYAKPEPRELPTIAKFSPGWPVMVTRVAVPGTTTVRLNCTVGACAKTMPSLNGSARKAVRAAAAVRDHTARGRRFVNFCATEFISESTPVLADVASPTRRHEQCHV